MLSISDESKNCLLVSSEIFPLKAFAAFITEENVLLKAYVIIPSKISYIEIFIYIRLKHESIKSIFNGGNLLFQVLLFSDLIVTGCLMPVLTV